MLFPPKASMKQHFLALQNVEYNVTFSGSYYTTSGPPDTKAFETVTLKMSQQEVIEGPLTMFKNEFAPEVFPAIYPDFKLLHHWRVDAATRSDGGPVLDINLMNRGEITSVVTREGLPINVSLYKNVDALREALFRYLQDEHGFAKEQEHRGLTLNKTAKLAGSFRERNAAAFQPAQHLNAAELQNKIVNQPSLYDVIATQNAITEMAKQDALLVGEVNTTGYASEEAMRGRTINGYMEDANKDEFLDGPPKMAGVPINNPRGTQQAIIKEQPRGF